MPEFVHTFNSGRMNKDLDERLVPNGEYRDALNLDLANSEGSNVGALQNVKGNSQIPYKAVTSYLDNWVNPVCIGSVADTQNDKLYWLIAADNYSGILEYDNTTNQISPVLIDALNNTLKFDANYIVTGINILDKFLIFTDNNQEPKRINIEKFKTGSVDFDTHTLLPDYDPTTEQYTYVATNPGVTEEYVTVIKKGPLNAPTLNMSASEYGSNEPGTGLNPVITEVDDTDGYENFTYVPDVAGAPGVRIPLPTYGEYLDYLEDQGNPDPTYPGSSIEGWNGEVVFNVNALVPAWTPGSQVLLSGSVVDDYNQTFEYNVRVNIVSVFGTAVTARIESISSDILIFNEPIEWEAVLEENAPMFEYVFPRFAYRWKYEDNEYSTFSPFSGVAFLGDDFEYVSSDGYNIGMTNNIRKLLIESLEWGNDEVVEIDILYKESKNTNVYVVDTLKRNEGEVNSFEVKSELIGKVVESNQILRPWDNVPRKALAQEIIGNRIVYGNYLQNYNVNGSVDLSTTVTSYDHPYALDPTNSLLNKNPIPSLKTIRTYQTGVVFKDKYGRETPVFTNKNATYNLPISNSDKVNKLSLTPQNTPPSFATHFKFFVKEISNEYYNLALDRFYFAEDGNVWLSFPSSERNKVDEETYLILKKQHDNDIAVDDLNRYKILAIENEAPEFISTFETITWYGNATIDPLSTIGPDVITIRFNTTTNTAQLNEALNNDAKIKIIKAGNQTGTYEIVSGGPVGSNDYEITLEEPFNQDASFLSPGDAVVLQVLKDEQKRKPEFEGRFFVKINRDFAFDTNIIESFEELDVRYAIKDETNITPGNPSAYPMNAYGICRDEQPGFWYGDRGWNTSQNSTSEYRLYGKPSWAPIPAGVDSSIQGENNGTSTVIQQQLINNGYQPPTKGSNTLGIMKVGVGVNEYFSPNFGKSNFFGNINSGVASDSLVSPNGFLQAGSKIRFRATKSAPASGNYSAVEAGDLSAVYTINYAVANTFVRGGQTANENDRQVDINRKYVIVMTLDRVIEDEWMPETGDWQQLKNVMPAIQVVEEFIDDNNKTLTSSNPAVFETEPKEAVDLDLYYEASNAIPINQYNNTHELDWFNCYTYGNGVESNRIRDDFNAPTIDKGPKVSSILDEPYAEERRKSSFIWSQIYNSTSGVNRLNQFIQAEKITKDLNPIYGSIQKLHTRDTDLITLCEDKCFRVLANKDALYNADGNTNITSNNNVLGQATPYAGEYGISKNPESFASYGFRTYFTDKNRGAVIRLSIDGITVVSEKGMDDFFNDNLKVNTKLLGSYDEDKGLYNLTLYNLTSDWQAKLSSDQAYHLSNDCDASPSVYPTQTTLSFKESVDGWTSRKSFIPEEAISLNNTYYSFKDGLIWEHNVLDTYNNFYGIQYDSSFNLLINDSFNTVKGFSTVNYTGTKSKRFEYLYNGKWYSIDEINAMAVTPTNAREKQPGWYVNYIKTDLEGGEVKEFLRKEGKWFNYIKGRETFDDCDTNEGGGGIGQPDEIVADTQDYILTVDVNKECSSTGETTPPDVEFTFWQRFTDNKTSNTVLINSQSTNNDVVCDINSFAATLNGNYNDVVTAGDRYRYYSTDGFQVGTQLYNRFVDTPVTSTRFFLLNITGGSISIPYLDPASSAYPPSDDYKIVKIENGIITEIVNYNTITCS